MFRIQIDIHTGDKPAEVNFQKLIVHAVLLDFAYKDNPTAIQGGEAYADIHGGSSKGRSKNLHKRDADRTQTFFNGS